MLNDAAGKIRLPLAEAMSKLADLGAGAIQEEDARNTTVYQLATILGRIQEWIDELLTLVQVEAGRKAPKACNSIYTSLRIYQRFAWIPSCSRGCSTAF